MARYEFIDGERATTNSDGTARYSVRKMCAWLAVSASGFYEWVCHERGRELDVGRAS